MGVFCVQNALTLLIIPVHSPEPAVAVCASCCVCGWIRATPDSSAFALYSVNGN